MDRRATLICILFLLLLLQSCFFESSKGELLFTEADPDEGFNYPYFLYVPEGVSAEDELVLIVEPNNSGFADDDLNKHKEKAGRIATLDYYVGNYVARKLKYPLLVPVFPRSKSDWKIYSHAFDRDVALLKNNPLERIDLQLIAMVLDASNRLEAIGYNVHEQVLMTGFSASGSFVNRFTAVHPEKVLAVAAGGTNGLLILPTATLEGEILNFPLGTGDFPELFGKQFDSISFINTPQYYYMGELDNNDAIPYEDAYDLNERGLVFDLLGEEMMPTRWQNCIIIYQNKKTQAQFTIYDGIGHENTNEIKEDVLIFFNQHLKNKI